MNKKITNVILVIFILVVIISAVYFLSIEFNKVRGTKHLDIIEIANYQGQKLDSINAFRENSIKGPQYVDIDKYELEVTGLIENPKNYKYDEIINGFDSYKKVVTLNCVEGWSATILWEGMLFRELIDVAKPTADANVIIFRAVDGYSTAFPIEYFYQNDILMAYKMNDAAMVPERGFPFQLVAETKWGYKWIKWISEIEFSDDKDYEGFWERRGYSVSGELDEHFLK
ncbi:molybdopterin-dependent oxidoreductase [Patescibacteria group bacterium]|nr:molybdopterin-dependent oxidoreductase [Patescibacteria group bacterium]